MSKFYSGGGVVFFEDYDTTTGLYGKMKPFGETEEVTLTSATEFLEHESMEGCIPKQDLKLPSKIAVSVAFSTSNISLANLTKAYGGTVITATQTVGTDVALIIAGADVELGCVIRTGYYNVTGLIVKDTTDLITYEAGVDYNFSKINGFLEIIEGGNIVTGVALNLTLGTVPAQDINTIATFKNSELLGRFTVVTKSQTDNNYEYIFKKLSIVSDGDFVLKGKELGSISFTGTALAVGETAGAFSDYVDMIELQGENC